MRKGLIRRALADFFASSGRPLAAYNNMLVSTKTIESLGIEFLSMKRAGTAFFQPVSFISEFEKEFKPAHQ